MNYFRTIGDAILYAFQQNGEVDDNGKKIITDVKPMTEKEYIEYKENKLKETIKNMEIIK